MPNRGVGMTPNGVIRGSHFLWNSEAVDVPSSNLETSAKIDVFCQAKVNRTTVLQC